MTQLETLRTAYLIALDALIARYPGQEVNRRSHLAWLERAELGTVTRRIRTKGGYTDISRGATVLFVPEDPELLAAERVSRPAGYEVFAPRADGNLGITLVGQGTVRPICRTCGGSGLVHPHPTALIAVSCPDC